ncbi:MAG: oligosaccharide flippase family protein [Chitinophagaceae bacterium]|nr:oligosaccharide flippase family protein [Chitinophagaceae bacterium]MCW5904659.1 oligosaccharide flippase family protein [Chitinophagaceae bacterium]
MGIVRKQSIYSSIFIYIGFGIGALNVLLLFPRFFTPEEFGLTRLLLDIALLYATFSTFGSLPITLKFFPFYNAYLPPKKNDLSFLTITLCIIGCLLFIGFSIIFKDFIIRKYHARSPLFTAHYNLLYPLTISITIFYLLESYLWTLKKTITTNIAKELILRISVTVAIALYFLKIIDIEQFFTLFSLSYLPSILLLLWSIKKSNHFKIVFSISSVTKRLWRKMFSFGFFIFSGNVLNVLSRIIDTIIIASQSANGLADAAIFIIPTYIVTLMDVPLRSITAISIPVISEAWKEKNKAKILMLYQKTSLNLLLIGLLIFGITYLSADNMVSFLGPTYTPVKEIMLILGIAKILDLGAGLNSQILLLSKYWKVDFITNMLFIVCAIPLNYFLIKSNGVIGAAYANLIALSFFNMIRFVYIWKLFKMQPFTQKTFLLLVLSAISFILVYCIPTISNIYIDSIVRSVLFVSLFSFCIVKFKISEDISEMLITVKNKYFSKR